MTMNHTIDTKLVHSHTMKTPNISQSLHSIRMRLSNIDMRLWRDFRVRGGVDLSFEDGMGCPGNDLKVPGPGFPCSPDLPWLPVNERDWPGQGVDRLGGCARIVGCVGPGFGGVRARRARARVGARTRGEVRGLGVAMDRAIEGGGGER